MIVGGTPVFASDNFKTVDSDILMRATVITTNDPRFTLSPTEVDMQWWLSKLKIPDAWEVSKGSRDVTVAIVDTGIDGLHEDLSDGRVGAGYASYCQSFAAGTNKCLVHQSGNIPAGDNSDDNGHGTIVAGIIGAIPNNGKGVAGIDWQVRMIPIKVLNKDGVGVSSDVAAGIIWAVDNGADIINMSLGGTSLETNAVLQAAIDYAHDADVLVVAAAGNDSSLVGNDLDIARVYPVCADGDKNEVLGVAATDMFDRKADFSNYGRSCIDLVAPGTTTFRNREDQKGILSTYFDPLQPNRHNFYSIASGTSIAAPMVSAAAALLESVHPELSAAAIRDRLVGSTENIDLINPDNCGGSSCTGRLGSGRLNIQKVLQTSTLISDSLVQSPSGRIFQISEGLKRPVSSYVFQQRNYKATAVKFITTTEEESLPTGASLPPLDGTLVKSDTQSLVYCVSAGLLQPVSYLAFVSNNLSFVNLAVLPESEVFSYRIGPNFAPANGALLKLAGQPPIYFLHEGKRRLISAFVFANRGYKFDKVVEVGQAEFDRYPEDPATKLLPPFDGALIKGDAEPPVYLISGGHRVPLSREEFFARGFKFSSVKTLPQSEVNLYLL